VPLLYCVEGLRWVGQKLSPIIASPASSTLTLRCPAAGDPSPNITWLKDGEPLVERYMGSVSSRLSASSSLYSVLPVVFTPYLRRSSLFVFRQAVSQHKDQQRSRLIQRGMTDVEGITAAAAVSCNRRCNDCSDGFTLYSSAS